MPAEIDQPYDRHKRHLLVRKRMTFSPSGGAPCLKLIQVLRVDLDQPERTGGGMGNLATPQSAAPQPSKQGGLRHIQAVGQLGESPFVETAVGYRRGGGWST